MLHGSKRFLQQLCIFRKLCWVRNSVLLGFRLQNRFSLCLSLSLIVCLSLFFTPIAVRLLSFCSQLACWERDQTSIFVPFLTFRVSSFHVWFLSSRQQLFRCDLHNIRSYRPIHSGALHCLEALSRRYIKPGYICFADVCVRSFSR